MKKFLSMLLVLTMVVTTLMGTMVIDVNAKASIDTTTDPDKITLQFGLASLPGNEANMNGVYGIGDWYAYGYLYSDEDLAKDPATTTITGTKSEEVQFLSTSRVENPLVGDLLKYDWKAGKIYDDAFKANGNVQQNGTTGWITDNKCSANYARLRILSPVTEGEITSVATADYGMITGDAIYQYTFYAYTDPNTTLDNKSLSSSRILLAYTLGGSAHIDPNIYSNQLPSANGVPHKVDVVFSSNGTTNYANVYIDGVQLSAGSTKANDSAKSIAFHPRFGDLGLHSATSLTIQDTDWYITLPETVPGTNVTAVSQDDVKAGLIVVPNFNSTTKATTYRTDDYITGVTTNLDKKIKAVLETTTVGDKIVDIFESDYNNPANLFDTTVANPTVKLVSRTTGEEVAAADATGTMDDYYFMVNGIYIIPNKVADPAQYVKLDNDPFNTLDGSTDKHGKISTRMLWENYVDNVATEAFGGLTTGFNKYTSEPRGSFYYSSGKIYYNQAGYYNVKMPGMVKRSTYEDYNFAKNMTTLQFDMYVPEYTYTSSENVKLAFSGFRNDTSTSNKNTRTALPTIIFTTNGKGGKPANSVDLVGNAWNTVAIQFDATNTPTSGNVDIYVYVNGEKQLTTKSTTGNYGATAENYISFLEYARFFMPSYSSTGIMNDAWYVGNYTPTVTVKTENVIDAANVSGVTISVDNENNLIAYDNSDDADYSKLITAMSAAGYNPVYERVVNKNLVEAKYDAVDGKDTYGDTYTESGVLVKRWIESSLTDNWIVNNGDTNADGLNEYEIINTAAITSAVDNGDGTATMTATSSLQDMNVYDGVATKANDIINMLIAEGNTEAATQTLVGFTSVNEDGKLPRVYSLQTPGIELYSLAYDEASKVATLNYREFAASDNISFVILVGAYDAKGKLLALDISETITIDSANEADGIKAKTFTADFGTLDLTTVKKYKVFAFENVTGALAIMPRAAVVNTAYVAPVE